ncbi:hypothetical protein [Clostridioides difficile]|uniref:hypothetical protein n=1 Tax=Clostridioides difficile TaxID=1496 RepID=UPI001033E50C|nr:hypothetical protein [Clostridioides difficile]
MFTFFYKLFAFFHKSSTKESQENQSIENKLNTYSNKKKKKGKLLTLIMILIDKLSFITIFLSAIIITISVVLLLGIFMCFMSFISIFNTDDITENKTNISNTVTDNNSSTTLSWTEEEFAQYSANLSDYEKNIYRLGIYYNNALKGYDGNPIYSDSEQSLVHLFNLGVLSTENGMQFFKGNKQYDISKIPSDIPYNSAGYGYLGLSRKESLTPMGGRIPAASKTAIRNKYKPTKSFSAESQYSPYGALALSTIWKEKQKTYADRTVDKVTKVVESWGIVENKEYIINFIKNCLINAQFHGAYLKDHPAYANFICAMYCATSDNDAERSFDKWTIEGGYDESSLRKSILGTSKHGSVRSLSNPSQFQKSLGGSKLILNGTQLKEPLWTFLWNKFSDKQGMKDAWNGCKNLKVADQVLNFHYGLNSYLQAARMQNNLAKKMGIQENNNSNAPNVSVGNFKETSGKGQAIVDGKTTEALLSSYSGSNKSYIMNTLKPHWGSSSFLQKKGSAYSGKYQDVKFGVPFFGQGNKFGESYGNSQWYPGGATYNRSGCMIYSCAYTVSALTGRLVNPPEMGAIMIMKNGLVSAGISMSNMPNVFSSLGLKSKYYEDNNWINHINEAVDKGGIAIIRLTKPYAAGSEHFVAITGRQGDKYNMYSSTHIDHSMQLQSKASLLKAKKSNRILCVWK